MKLDQGSPSATLPIWGLALLEGNAFRSGRYLSMAIRTQNQKVRIRGRRQDGFRERFPLLRLPFLRGPVLLLEYLGFAVEALGYSAQVLSEVGEPESEKDQPKEGMAPGSVMVAVGGAFLVGLLLFVALPHLIRDGLGVQPASEFFHWIDGGIKVALVIVYILAISLLPEIRRLFQYQSAQHRVTHCLEKNFALTVASVQSFGGSFYPRCPTTFLLVAVFVSVLFFGGVFPLLGIPEWDVPVLGYTWTIVLKLLFLIPLSSLVFELLELGARHAGRGVVKGLLFPVWLVQKLVTREPKPEQIEIALCALRQLLRLEQGVPSPVAQSRMIRLEAEWGSSSEEEFEIQGLEDLGMVKWRESDTGSVD